MSDPVRFSAADVRRRVAERLGPGDVTGDHSFNPGLRDRLLAVQRRAAAVLIPVVDREPEATLLLTLRHGDLRAHSGEIAFPGGRIDPGDASAEAAALREAEEEVGLRSEDVEILGRAPDYLTGSGYHVVPVIGVVQPAYAMRLNPAEVVDAFETPLSFLMNPANHRRDSRVWNGATRHFFAMPYETRNIWGVTAGMIRILYERLYGEILP